MAWQTSIADVLNKWDAIGVFDYAIPFLLLFAVIYGILSKTNILGDNKGVNAIVSVAVGLLALQFDFVSTFFATIFPRLGVVLAILLVVVILLGLGGRNESQKIYLIVGIVLAVAAVLWALSSWSFWGEGYGISLWFEENFWALLIGVILILGVLAVIFGKKGENKPSSGGH
jgi:hypothetical protein